MRCLENWLSVNYQYHLMGKDTPLCCTNHLYKILGKVIRVLGDKNIPYIATYGTHLGAVRHAALIPWDTDIDIAILSSYRKQVIEALSMHLPSNFRVECANEMIRIYIGEKNNLHVDIEFWNAEGEICFWSDDIYVGYREVSLTYFTETTILPFGPLNITCPKSSQILTDIYGHNWKTVGYKKWALFNKRVDIEYN